MSTERRSVPWEQHFQTILITLITGALIFAANYFYTDNRAKADFEAKAVSTGNQLQALTKEVYEMRGDLRTLQLNYARREEMKELEIRVRALEIRR
jgi:hypothetical protein